MNGSTELPDARRNTKAATPGERDDGLDVT